jgi:alkaline phosphatase
MKRLYTSLFLLALAAPSWGADKAKNVIIFLGDAAGIPMLHAASIQAHGNPTGLFVQRMPNIALSDTSSATDWITDSAAGMTAIVTGQKTKNGVLSEMPAVGTEEGRPLKTILEYAEEHGLSTGVISNSPMYDATPAACYAHASSRKKTAEIFAQIWNPRFGDGVDLVLGPGRKALLASMAEMGIDMAAELKKKGYWYSDRIQDMPPAVTRAVVLTDDTDYDIAAATKKAIAILSRNPKGFFLMVESDLHTDKLSRALDRAPKFDRLIEETVKQSRKDTLVLFTADHSFDVRLVKSIKKGEPLFTLDEAGKAVPNPGVVVVPHHSGEQVMVGAEGPGSQRVHGFLVNTDLFHIMLSAYGWEPDKGVLKSAVR